MDRWSLMDRWRNVWRRVVVVDDLGSNGPWEWRTSIKLKGRGYWVFIKWFYGPHSPALGDNRLYPCPTSLRHCVCLCLSLTTACCWHTFYWSKSIIVKLWKVWNVNFWTNCTTESSRSVPATPSEVSCDTRAITATFCRDRGKGPVRETDDGADGHPPARLKVYALVNKPVPCAWLLSGALEIWSLRLGYTINDIR